LLSFQRNGSLDRAQARLLADIVNRATRSARQGRPFQAAVQLRVFRLRAGILGRRGALTSDDLEPLLTASQAALDLLRSDGRDGSTPSRVHR